MTIKSVLFCIFLYVCLVWVGAAYLFIGDPAKLQQTGLFWTGAGLLAVLGYILIARIWSWWRLWRARAAARPRATATGRPAPAVHEDDAGLTALLAEANSELAKSPEHRGRHAGSPLARLPLYLLIGPEGSGKTTTFVNSGLDPQLLAGQVGSSGSAPTRLGNLWLAKNALFVELSGRLFTGDPDRWLQLLRLLRGGRKLPLWRRLRGDAEESLTLRGAVAFCDVREFSGASADPQRFERYCRLWQDRLRGIGEAFGVDFPVYTVISKSDTIPFFPDFFRRLPDADASQALGRTLPWRSSRELATGEVYAESEAKRITASFRPLYHALAERRILHLAQEPVAARRPGIYEYPRELKRIRNPLVQFLTDALRPHPLQPGARLRGYYFTGTREVEVAAAMEAAAVSRDFGNVDFAVTRLFAADTTQIFRTDDSARPPGGKGLVRRWMFVADLFHSIVLRDAPPRTAPRVDHRIDTYRRGAVAAVCGASLLLCFIFFGSWLGNRSLLTDVQAAGVAAVQRPAGPVTLTDLQSLDQLRRQVKRLREGAGLRLHWGLYSGDAVLEAARTAYFRRFQQLLLNDLNARIVRGLAETPATAGEDAYNPTYAALKTHLTISTGVCKLDAALTGRVLKGARGQSAPTASPEWNSLADAQIDFYLEEYGYGNPCRIAEDAAARDNARAVLRKLKGVDRIYATILDGAAKSLPKPQRLSDLAANYTQVLSGPPEPGAAFTQAGWTAVEKESKNAKSAALGEACVVGNTGGAGDWRQDAEVEHAIQRRFLHDYVAQWRNYVAGFSVNRYASAEDAAKKLEILSANNSPLLALLALTANQTSFPPPVDGAVVSVAKKAPILGELLKGGEKAAAKVPGMHPENPDDLTTPADIARYFQPVHSVVAPQSQTWVTEKTKAYIEALADLGRSMREIAHGGGAIDPAAHQAASQNADKAQNAASQISRAFNPIGVEGLDQAARILLERPIQLARPFIKTDLDAVTAEKLNGQLKNVCVAVTPMLAKYPFNQASKEDARLDEFASAFAPTGAILKFAGSLGELVVKEGSQWKAKDPNKKPQVRPELLNFLNAAQRVADGLFPPGAAQPQLRYTLRPKLDGFGDTKLELEIDGAPHVWNVVLQKDFSWPPAAGAKDAGAIARLRFGNISSAFLSETGIWAIFRIMGYAEPRELTEKLVVWKYSRVGRPDAIKPGPVQVEILNGTQALNPKFFEGLQRCPARGAQ